MAKRASVFDMFTEQNILSQPFTDLNKSLKKYALSEKVAVMDASADVQPHRPPKQLLRELIGKPGAAVETIGPHPDFHDIDSNAAVYHYIVSVFVDIQGSTRLAAKFPLEDVRRLKNGLLVTAIDIFQAFDGHVHRLQGDAVFAFFGGRAVTKWNAIVDALNATSTLQYYVKNHLSPLFESQGLPPIKIRVGIDFGDDDEVLWSRYGIKFTSEVTTTSLHTDLAAKLQAKASANSIMIGNNIVDFLDLPDDFYYIKQHQKDGDVVDDRWIMKNEYVTYPMWVFDWQKYYKQFAVIEHRTDTEGISLSCQYRFSDADIWTEYKANSSALAKGLSLRFQVNIPSWVEYDDIEWNVVNSGTEATDAGQLNFEMEKYQNQLYCIQATAYKGHHYMNCVVRHRGRVVGLKSFPLFVGGNRVGE